jgi:hypothetical protein
MAQRQLAEGYAVENPKKNFFQTEIPEKPLSKPKKLKTEQKQKNRFLKLKFTFQNQKNRFEN